MREWKARLSVLVSYVGLALVYAWPLPLHMWERVVLTRGSDFYPHIWNLWWMRFSLLDLNQNPYHTDYLHHPTGLPLVFHVLDPLNGLLSIPLQGVFGLLAAFNLLRLMHLVFAASATYALCRTLGLPRWASWSGGALFMLSPVASVSFDLGQLVEISTGWLPLFILCLIRAVGNSALRIAPGHWGWVVGAGLALSASFLVTPYFFTALCLFALLYVAWEAVTLTRRGGVRAAIEPVARAAMAGALAIVMLSPLLIAIVSERPADGSDLSSALRTVIANSADLLSPFLPLPSRLDFPEVNPHGGTAALGWTVILLAAAAFLRGRRDDPADPESSGAQGSQPAGTGDIQRTHKLFWLVVTAAFTLLALGPHLLVAGNDTGLPMPFALLAQLPFLDVARVPLRFILMSSLALSVLAAFGLAALVNASPTTRKRLGLSVAVSALAVVELIGVPRHLVTPVVHPFFETIARNDPSNPAEPDGAVLELPQRARTARAMYSQTVHRRPIVGGYTSRHYPYPWLSASPGAAQLSVAGPIPGMGPDIISPPIDRTALAALDYYNVRYIALYEEDAEVSASHTEASRASEVGDEYSWTREAVQQIVVSANIPPLYQDRALTVYRVPPRTWQGPLVGLGMGWYKLEGSGEQVWRWTDSAAQVQITNPSGADMQVTLDFSAFAYGRPRLLSALLDGNPVGEQFINPHPAQQMSIPLTLTPGEHWLTLRSPDPAEVPPGDSRPVSIGFERVSIEQR